MTMAGWNTGLITGSFRSVRATDRNVLGMSGSSKWPRRMLAGGAIILVAFMIVVLVFFLAGGRWFVVETPSMGKAAPVGTLVIDAPVNSPLRVGDVITFHPPTAPAEVYTHRIIAIGRTGVISTRGDINGGVDPWQLHAGDVIGEAFVLLPGVGWLVRGLPFIVVGITAVWFFSRRVSDTANREALRIVGFSSVVAIVAAVLRPFVGVSLLGEVATASGGRVAVVSTGLLPTAITVVGGNDTVRLTSGAVGDIDVPKLALGGHFHLATSLDLSASNWIIFWVICAVPLLWCLIVGLPSDGRSMEPRAGARHSG